MMGSFRSARYDRGVSVDRAIAPTYGRLVHVAHSPVSRLTHAASIFRLVPVLAVVIVCAPQHARGACGGWVSWTDETSLSSRLDRFVASLISSNGDERDLSGRETSLTPIAPKLPSPCALGLCSKTPAGPFDPPRVARVSSDSWIALSVDPIRAQPRSTRLFLDPIVDSPRLIPESIDRPPRDRRLST